MKVVEHKPGWHWHEGFQSEQRFRAVCHQGYRPFRGDMQAADESGQSTLQTSDGLMDTSKYPYFPVYFARPGENLEIPARPLSCSPSVSAVEGESHAAGRRSNSPPILKGFANM